MKNLAVLALMLFGAVEVVLAGPAAVAPEIDPSSSSSALALLSGGLLVLRSRRNQK